MHIVLRLFCCLLWLVAGVVPAQAHSGPAAVHQGTKPRAGSASPPVKAVPHTERKSKPQRIEARAPAGREQAQSARSSRPERTARSARSGRGAEGGRSARGGGSSRGNAGAGRGHGRGH
ncbi:hypothetical protein [Hymenobacter metallicola]|uniref:Translation initiation factor IF-2 n=1 Tax=Hymenobacter metallicola TaxID=2563114 RepID=A0A4Z0QI13_9BACT|nr:hypothetical protein [Hymenobacter metallicola]TGE29414.1 hypothetical protein E5K02_08165 [Hymenobacter metallicola]